MISLAAARSALVQVITDHAPSIRSVHGRAVDDPVIATPAVILAAGVDGTFGTTQGACAGAHVDTIDLPVVVLVERSGLDEQGTQEQLEVAWVQVLDAIRGHLHDDPLRQVGITRRVKTVEAASYVVGGTEYPAQVLHIEFEG